MQNLFHPGDNLDGLQRVAELGIKVDLVYIDPPFATNNEFLIDTDRANSVSRSGQLAYSDTTVGAKYLDELKARLQAISFVMNPTGSVYVHIDVNMEHHVRLLMDQVFGQENFRNSITRIKCNPRTLRVTHTGTSGTLYFSTRFRPGKSRGIHSGFRCPTAKSPACIPLPMMKVGGTRRRRCMRRAQP